MPGSGRFELRRGMSLLISTTPRVEGWWATRRRTLSDSGEGMAPEVVARAFEPFLQQKKSDLGRGLVSPRSIASQQSGGAVSIVSAIGKGSSITLFLPRAVEGHPVAPFRMAAPRPRGHPPAS